MSCAQLDALVAEMQAGRVDVISVLNGLKQLATADENTNVIMDIGGNTYTIDSINKAMAQLEAGGLVDIQNKQTELSQLISGLIQQTERVNNVLELPSTAIFWDKRDLTNLNSLDVDNSIPTFNAQIENGIRNNYDAYVVKDLDRQYATDGVKISDWLMPAYTTVVEDLFTSALPAANDAATTQENVAKYGAIQRTVTTAQINYRRYYYGRYYRWYRSYIGSYVTYKTETVSEGIDGSMAAETFKLDIERVTTEVRMLVKNPGSNKGTANPRVLLCETSLGMPVLDKVLAKGTLKEDVNASSNDNAVVTIFLLERPVLLRANTSYAVVIITDNGSTWDVWYNANENNKGQVFFTQDGSYWQADLAKDFIVQIGCADFGEGIANWVVSLGNISVSGGIVSANLNKIADLPAGGDVAVEVEINSGTWLPVDVFNGLESQPANINLRATYTGSRYAFPLLNTRDSKLTAFSPKLDFDFFSTLQEVPKTTGTLRITYNLAGFDETDYGSGAMHTFTPRIQVDGQNITADVIESKTASSGDLTQFEATFTLPPGTVEYRDFIEGKTLLKTNTFDVQSIIVSKQ